MGDRSYIVIQSNDFDSDVILYGHHAGDTNAKVVAEVLAFTDRIGDPNHLTAQIFHKFAEHYDGKLGFGIAAINPTDGFFDWADSPTVYVNADNGKYSIGGDDWFDRWSEPTYKFD